MRDEATWGAVRREFSALLDMTPEARQARLGHLTADLRAEVESLLEALEASPAFLEAPLDGGAPSTIGPYRVLAEIGRGGMGVVYRAERADGEFTREVAIKLAGGRMFGPEAERRFIRERQILAGLEHPHIVRLLDGGIAGGQRYFVMELVNGVPITEYGRGRDLTARLRLLIDVCSAIHYAHQRLVLHRDLKPGNIIVNAEGQVKVLDFGIAQLLQDDTASRSATETLMHPLSLACASPEQLRGEPLSLSSDIYSLGVLLYELATGRNPQFAPGASYDENLRRAIHEDPPAPSRLVPSLPRDLDAVTLKALSKRPEDRYASVAELQSDLARLIEGRPVLAIPPRTAYVLRRFAARNKALTGAAAALLVALLAGSAYYVRQSRIEQRRFEDARRLVHAVVFDIQPRLESIPATLPLRKTLIEQTLAYLEAVSQDAGNNVSLLRELANSYVQLGVIQGDALASNLGDRQAAARDFTQATALMDRALALASGDAGLLTDASVLNRRRSDFALQNETREEARRLADVAVSRAERAVSLAPADPAAQEARALAWFARGRAVLNADQDEALAYFERARAHFSSASARDTVPPREAGLIELFTSDVFIKRGDKERGPAHARESLRIAQQILAARPTDPVARQDVATAAGQLAAGLVNMGQEAEAFTYFTLSTDMREQIVAADPDNVRARERLALAKGRFGTMLARAGDLPAARVALDRSVELYEDLHATGRLAATMEADFAEVLGHMGDYQQRTGNPRGACASFRRAADILLEANARVPLTALRKQLLDFNLEELEQCP